MLFTAAGRAFYAAHLNDLLSILGNFDGRQRSLSKEPAGSTRHSHPGAAIASDVDAGEVTSGSPAPGVLQPTLVASSFARVSLSTIIDTPEVCHRDTVRSERFQKSEILVASFRAMAVPGNRDLYIAVA